MKYIEKVKVGYLNIKQWFLKYVGIIAIKKIKIYFALEFWLKRQKIKNSNKNETNNFLLSKKFKFSLTINYKELLLF